MLKIFLSLVKILKQSCFRAVKIIGIDHVQLSLNQTSTNMVTKISDQKMEFV